MITVLDFMTPRSAGGLRQIRSLKNQEGGALMFIVMIILSGLLILMEWKLRMVMKKN